MSEPNWQKKHFVLALLTFACVLVDVGFFLAMGAAVKWLAVNTSPFVWAGLTAVVIVAMRVLLSLRQHSRRRGLLARLPDLASF